MKRHHKFSLAFVLTTVAGTTVGFALWSTNGIGTTQAKALSAQALTVTAATATSDLYPGYTHGGVTFTVTNPNPYPVTITSLTPGTVTSSSPVACPASNITEANATSLAISVAANATSATQTVGDVLTMVSTAPDGCQGVTFTVAVTVSGSQA